MSETQELRLERSFEDTISRDIPELSDRSLKLELAELTDPKGYRKSKYWGIIGITAGFIGLLFVNLMGVIWIIPALFAAYKAKHHRSMARIAVVLAVLDVIMFALYMYIKWVSLREMGVSP